MAEDIKTPKIGSNFMDENMRLKSSSSRYKY